MKVFLDDQRSLALMGLSLKDGWVHVTTSKEVIDLLKENEVDEMWLDHDLGVEDDNGYKVLLWLEKAVIVNGFKPPRIIRIHSANTSAAKRMEQAVQKILGVYYG